MTMKMLFEAITFDSSLTQQTLNEIQVFSRYEVVNEKKGVQNKQKIFVPEQEYEIYEKWKKDMEALILKVPNAVLRENIARRHYIRLPR